MMALHATDAQVPPTPAHTTCMSSNIRPRRAVTNSWRSACT